MKNFFTFILTVFCFFASHAQIHEIGALFGGTNVVSDVGSTNYINPNEFGFGVIYKWNRSERHSWRFSYMQSKLTGQDEKSDMPSRITRDFDFENKIHEFSVGLEFNFFEFDLHKSNFVATPYMFTGFNATIYDEQFITNKTSHVDYRDNTFAIPMILGVKARISDHWVLGLETGARWTFTDNIDGSNPENENFSSLRFGNLNSNDWYMWTGLTLTYTFGQNPCFCGE